MMLSVFKRVLDFGGGDGGYILRAKRSAREVAGIEMETSVREAFADFTYWKCHIYLHTEDTLRRLARKAGLQVRFIEQVRRYPLSNHLHWLSKGKPGGHLAYRARYLERLAQIPSTEIRKTKLDERWGLYELYFAGRGILEDCCFYYHTIEQYKASK